MNIPRLFIAAPASGSGKTTITCAVLQAFCNHGLAPAAFKCGPDYIDPMFHREIIGAQSANLDLFLCDRETVQKLFFQRAKQAGLSMIEGVMGYYDGIGLTDRAGGYDLALTLRAPVVLVVDARGAGQSLLAQIKGFLSFREPSGIKGVIFNRLSPSLYPKLKERVEKELGIRSCGYFPPMPDCVLQSRHLGLVTAGEVENLKALMQRLAEQAEQTVDLDGLLTLAENAPDLPDMELLKDDTGDGKPVRIAIARDRAFCFYYEDALLLLEQLGAELVPFSPINDAKLPPGCAGVLLGGGYPELYAEQLENNTAMRRGLYAAVRSGMPCIAECGGFLYLHDSMEDDKGTVRNMAGVIQAHAAKSGRLQHFGYATLTAQRDTLLCRKGEQIPCHEFHYWMSTDEGNSFLAEKPGGTRRWSGIHASETLYAGFPHIHFCSNPDIARSFLAACIRFAKS